MSDNINANFSRIISNIRPHDHGGDGVSFDIEENDMFSFLRENPTANVGVRITFNNMIKTTAANLLKNKEYGEAQEKYTKAIAIILGDEFRIPLPVESGLKNEKYMKLHTLELVGLVECCNGMAQCMIGLGNIAKALEWLEEVYVLWKNNYFLCGTVHYEWTDYNMQLTENFYEQVAAYRTASDVFLDIGNTGASVQRRWHGHITATSMPDVTALNSDLVWSLIPIDTLPDTLKLRHPDPGLVVNLTVKHKELQIRGSWKKIRTHKPSGFPARAGFASFVWNGSLYILGGQKKFPDIQTLDILAAYPRDMWCLDLNKLDGWKQLPSCPIPYESVAMLIGLQMSVHEDKAYLFTGHPQVDFFDLKTKEWGSIATSFMRDNGRAGSASWPYPGKSLTDYAMHMVDGRMYIFGGSHANASLGCNLFVMLDLQTKQWKKLSGTLLPAPDYSCPGPRTWPATWIREDKMYLMYGVADRLGAQMNNQPHGGDDAFGYSDFWSWSFTDNQWRREIVRGNPPCPRAEAGCTYNKKLDQTVMFGGYAPTYPTMYLDSGKMFNYSYYADTFIWSPSSCKWKQVLTHGFPTYRAQAQLVSDPETGKVFLFGEYTATDYIRSRKGTVSRSFGDLWQLCINEPGGYFEGVDLVDEARTAQAGPWQRCFACGSAGQWKKCGGACKGRVFFCDATCLKEGWKEHKTQHKCRK